AVAERTAGQKAKAAGLRPANGGEGGHRDCQRRYQDQQTTTAQRGKCPICRAAVRMSHHTCLNACMGRARMLRAGAGHGARPRVFNTDDPPLRQTECHVSLHQNNAKMLSSLAPCFATPHRGSSVSRRLGSTRRGGTVPRPTPDETVVPFMNQIAASPLV